MSDLPLVVVIDPEFADKKYDGSIEKDILKNIANVECWNLFHPGEVDESKIGEANAVLVWTFMEINAELLKKMKKCKVVVRIGMGFDKIDLKTAGELGIKVCNVPDYGVEEVADSTLCMILNLMRRTYFVANATKHSVWSLEPLKGARRVYGKVLGLVGIGRIAMAVAVRAKSFGLRVVFYDPYPLIGIDKVLEIERLDTLEHLLGMSDIVSLHCPLTSTNQHMMNDKTFALMKDGSFFQYRKRKIS